MRAGNRKIVAVFGSSRPKPGDAAYEQAEETGREIASAGWTVINGGYGGTMEAAAKGAKQAGGYVIGVTVAAFSRQPNRFTDDTICVKDLWERLRILIERSDAYIALTGATGTLAEVAVAWELLCKGPSKSKPLILLGDFWQPLYRMLVPTLDTTAAACGLVKTAQTPREAVDILKRFWEE